MQEILSKISIAARIKDLRQKAGLSQAEVAHNLTISRSNYSQIELGNQFPTFEVLYRLATFYGKTYEWFLHGDQHKVYFSGHECQSFDELNFPVEQYREVGVVSFKERNAYIERINKRKVWRASEKLPDVICDGPGVFRAFEIDGHSMRNALFHGDILIARNVSGPEEIKDQCIYVLITEKNIFIERVVVSNRTSGLLISVSDADPLDRRVLAFSEIREIWKAEGKYSKVLSRAVENINEYINHFDASIAELKQEIERIKGVIGQTGSALIK